jgi:hypothetical protein
MTHPQAHVDLARLMGVEVLALTLAELAGTALG